MSQLIGDNVLRGRAAMNAMRWLSRPHDVTDEFERSEVFGDVLPEWAKTVLKRIVQVGH